MWPTFASLLFLLFALLTSVDAAANGYSGTETFTARVNNNGGVYRVGFPYDVSNCGRIITLHKQGVSCHQIAKRLELEKSSVSRRIRTYEQEGHIRNGPQNGARSRPPLLRLHEDFSVSREFIYAQSDLIFIKRNVSQTLG